VKRHGGHAQKKNQELALNVGLSIGTGPEERKKMDKEKHKKADELQCEIENARLRIEKFISISNTPPGQIESRIVTIQSFGTSITVTGACFKNVSGIITESLKQELSELEKQYEEL